MTFFKHCGRYFRILTLFSSLVYLNHAQADCNAIFKDALQTSLVTGVIQFNPCGGQVFNSPDNLLETSSVTPASCVPATCNTVNCAFNSLLPQVGTMTSAYSASPNNVAQPAAVGGVITLLTLTAAQGYQNITVASGQTLNFSGAGPWRLNGLTIQQNAIVNFPSGDVSINTFSLSGGATLRTVNGPASGTARIYIDDNINLNQNMNWNVNTNNPDRMLVYMVGGGNTMTFNNAAMRMVALVYTQGNVDLNTTATTGSPSGFAGAIVSNDSGTSIRVRAAARATYIAPVSPNYGSSTCTSPNLVDHFLVSGPTSGDYCNPLVYNVLAKNGDNITVTNFTGTIILKTDASCTSAGAAGGICNGTWSVNTGHVANLVPGSTANNGYAEYTFSNTGTPDNGSATFNLNFGANGAGGITLSICRKLGAVSSNICNTPATTVTFAPFSYAISANGSPTQFTGPVTGGSAFNLNVVAFQAGCGVLTSYTGSKNIKFWNSYVNPATGAAPIAPCAGNPFLLNGIAIGTTQPTATAFNNITFTAGVSSNFSGQYNDTGRIQVNVQDSTNTYSGITGQFVVQPSNFLITGTGIPAASNSAALVPAFAKAGQTFPTTVTVKSGACTAANYGNEVVPESVTMTATLNAPAGGVLGTFTPGTATKTGPGTFSLSPSYAEVGFINVASNVASGSYLGSGAVPNGTTQGPVGRFQPDHFTVTGNTPILTSACSSGFTYVGQGFTYNTAPILTVVAKNVGNSVTQNYTGTFKKISATNFPAGVQIYSQNTTTTSGTPAISVGSLPNPTESIPSNGTQTYTFSTAAGGLSLQKPAATSTPYPNFLADIRLSLAVSDSDTPAVTGVPTPFVFNGTGSGIAFNNGNTFYQGRLVLLNASGSNLLPISVPVQTQFYTSNGYTINTLDNCTAISNAAHILVNNPAPPANVVTPGSVSPPGTLSAGLGNIGLGVAAGNPTGQTNLELLLDSGNANLPWLQAIWPYSTTSYANPRAQVNWGFYPGSPKIIYQQENYP